MKTLTEPLDVQAVFRSRRKTAWDRLCLPVLDDETPWIVPYDPEAQALEAFQMFGTTGGSWQFQHPPKRVVWWTRIDALSALDGEPLPHWSSLLNPKHTHEHHGHGVFTFNDPKPDTYFVHVFSSLACERLQKAMEVLEDPPEAIQETVFTHGFSRWGETLWRCDLHAYSGPGYRHGWSWTGQESRSEQCQTCTTLANLPTSWARLDTENY